MKPIPDPSPEKAGLPEFMGASSMIDEPLGEALRPVPMYRPGEAVKSVMGDDRFQRIMFMGLIFCFIFSGVEMPPGAGLWSGLAWVLLVGWIVVGFSHAGLWQDVARASQLIESHPGMAEHVLSGVGARRILPSAIRVNYFYRLGLVRFRQQRYWEAAAIADDLLLLEHKSMGQHRANLLLMRTECALRMNDLAGAYRGLAATHGMELSLMESLQRLVLQTHYEVAVGRFDCVVYGWKEKVNRADMMPPPQCRMMHEMLAQGAERSGMADLAHWLSARANLLGDGAPEPKPA